MEYIICLALGFYVGYKIAEAILLFTFKKVLEEFNIGAKELESISERLGVEYPKNPTAAAEDSEEEELPKVAIEVEQLGTTLYAYRKDNGRFLGQATSPEELIIRIGERLSNVKLIVSREDGGELLGGRNWNYDIVSKEFNKAE